MRGWQYKLGTYDDRDLKLTDQLIAELGKRYQTAPEHTFAAGFSNGGHFVFLLNAQRNDRFAAFAAIGALQPEYASDAPGFIGLDQVNIKIPASLDARGEVNLVLLIDGKRSQTVRVNVQ